MSTIHLHINANGQAVVSATEDPNPVTVSTLIAEQQGITREQALIQVGLEGGRVLDQLDLANEFFITTMHSDYTGLVVEESVGPTLEEEIVNQETILQYYETLSLNDRQALVAALRTDEIAVLARERAERTARNQALGVHTGKTIDEYSTSAWQIKQDYPDSEDGVYWIQNDAINNGEPVQVYCDMTTLGGGWTLIVQNSACEWQTDQLFLLNETTAPAQLVGHDVQSTDYNYSILSWADRIKSAESGFDFMITAREHGSLGGAWTANEPYSFVQTFDSSDMGDAQLGTPGWRKNITELARWGYNGNTWNYDDNAMEARMPWVGIGINYGWLTTDGFRGGWWGTLVTGGGWYPAPWLSTIEGGAHPGAIWYWVR